MDLSRLLQIALKISESLPSQVVHRFANEIGALATCPTPDRLAALGYTPRSRELLSKLATAWSSAGPDVDGKIVATALLAASHVVQASARERAPEIAWTGPSTVAVPTRRVDQVLYELIEEARSEIWLISYVAYGADRAIDAVAKAAASGVAVHLILELATESGGKLAFDAAQQIRSRMPSAKIYFWPQDKRPVDEMGRRGILHAKCIVSDKRAALISSANLTDYALELNMELGLVIRNGEIPRKIAQHFDQLVLQGDLKELA